MLIPDYKALFIHIPKTGGQSLTEFFLRNTLKKVNYDKYGAVDIDSNPELGLQLNMGLTLPGPNRYHHLFLSEYLENKLINVDKIDEYFKFTVIRDPYDRFLSAFYFLELEKTYKTYFDLTKDIPKFTDKHGLYRMFCPQIQYIEPLSEIDKFFTTENIKNAFDFFRKKFNFQGEDIHRNKRSPKHKYSREHDLDHKTRNFIKDFYKKDFELYNEIKSKED